MKRWIVLVAVIFAFVTMTACKKESFVKLIDNESNSVGIQSIEENIEDGNIINSIVPEKTNIAKQGVGMPANQQLSSEMVKGDDGNCYYFRKRNKKIIFYKNNGVKVCEVESSDLIENKGYKIASFVKYKDKFFLQLFSYKKSETILTAIQIATGEWCAEIHYDYFDKIIIYDNCFFCAIYNELTIVDLQGNKTKINIESEDKEMIIQMILDDKIWYIVFSPEGETAEVDCCDLDGKNKKKLFQYRTIKGYSGYSDPGILKVDEKYLYLLETNCEFMLTRIPLYGGQIEEIVESEWYDLSDKSIFYSNNTDIYRLDKVMKEKAEVVSNIFTPKDETPFFYANNHLIVCDYNKKAHKMIDTIWESEIQNSIVDDIEMNYYDSYYWMTEDGKVQCKIQGSGFRNEWEKLYNIVK